MHRILLGLVAASIGALALAALPGSAAHADTVVDYPPMGPVGPAGADSTSPDRYVVARFTTGPGRRLVTLVVYGNDETAAATPDHFVVTLYSVVANDPGPAITRVTIDPAWLTITDTGLTMDSAVGPRPILKYSMPIDLAVTPGTDSFIGVYNDAPGHSWSWAHAATGSMLHWDSGLGRYYLSSALGVAFHLEGGCPDGSYGPPQCQQTICGDAVRAGSEGCDAGSVGAVLASANVPGAGRLDPDGDTFSFVSAGTLYRGIVSAGAIAMGTGQSAPFPGSLALVAGGISDTIIYALGTMGTTSYLVFYIGGIPPLSGPQWLGAGGGRAGLATNLLSPGTARLGVFPDGVYDFIASVLQVPVPDGDLIDAAVLPAGGFALLTPDALQRVGADGTLVDEALLAGLPVAVPETLTTVTADAAGNLFVGGAGANAGVVAFDADLGNARRIPIREGASPVDVAVAGLAATSHGLIVSDGATIRLVLIGGGNGGPDCRVDCTRCGDDVIDASEECDDGDGVNSDTAPDACRVGCLLPSCGDGVVDVASGEACEGPKTAVCDGDCTAPVCGDGVFNALAGEGCDRGTGASGNSDTEVDGCRTTCKPASCGDGVVDSFEACDAGTGPDGNSDLVPDRCRLACTLPRCGDAVLDAGEACDDGNDQFDDGCGVDCEVEVCGDGILQPSAPRGETCDDAGESAACDDDCSAAACGDGVVNATADEECDTDDPQECDLDCTLPVCGDGLLNASANEDCDDGDLNSDTAPGACREDCRLAGCGDLVVDPDEACDDGNSVGEDGCSTTCALEVCGDGVVQGGLGETCDDGGETADCDADCTAVACGDGVVNATAGESCDDAGESAACNADCSLAACGDGLVNAAAGEACDDGDGSGGGNSDGNSEGNSDTAPGACRTTCQLAACGDAVVDPGEGCDDGNALGGDGCSATCQVTIACGDGILTPDEACDDGNALAGDGCFQCALETGWDCAEGTVAAPGSPRSECLPARLETGGGGCSGGMGGGLVGFLAALFMALSSLVPGWVAKARAATPTFLWFRPAFDLQGFFEVEGVSDMRAGDYAAGLMVRLDDTPLTFRLIDSGTTVLSQVEADVGLHAYGSVSLTKWLQVGLEMPISIDRKGAIYGMPGFEPDGVLPGDLRIGVKLVPLTQLEGVSFGVGVTATLPTGNGDSAYGLDALAVTPTAILSARHWAGNSGYLFWSLNVGAHIAPDRAFTGLPLGSELVLGAGLGWHFAGPRVSLMAEAAGRTQLDDLFGTVGGSPAEVGGGVRWFPIEQLALSAGLRTGIAGGYGATDLRALIGLAWVNRSHDTPEGPGDRDGDGLLDDVDKCPEDPEDKDGFEDQDGCPDSDNDKDGIMDVVDGCPLDAEDPDGFEDTDGCPDPDNDRDGIADASDKCPNEAENRDGYQDDDGCPEPPPELALEQRAWFDYDSAVVREDAKPALRQAAEQVKAHPEVTRFTVDGHADERGTHEYNDALSMRRAEAVIDFLASEGIARDRMLPRGFGKRRPLVEGSDESAWQKNRRVELTIMDIKRGP